MEKNILNQPTHRRGFMGILAKSAALMSISSFGAPLLLDAETVEEREENFPGNPDAWFDKIKGKHRIVFDVTHPKDVLPFAWPRVFLITNEKTGTPAKDCGVVVILRHDAIPYAFEDRLWAKYNFGEMFNANDPETKKPSLRNPFWKPKQGAFKVPGFGVVSLGINELQESGVMFCVCDAAMTVYSAVAAEKMGMDAADVKKEWLAGILPGVQPVPSGVWAVGRAQEHKCSYCAVA